MDSRIRNLARSLVRYSTALQPGDNVLIDLFGVEVDIGRALIEEAYAAGAVPFLNLNHRQLERALLMGATERQVQMQASWDLDRMKQMQAYIAIRSGDNVNELSDVPADKQALHSKVWNHPVHTDTRVKSTRWVVLRWPTHAMAQLAGTSTEAFEDFYFDVCGLDYARMDRAMDGLERLMDATDRVHIKGPGTDLSFSIKGIGSVKCSGKRNIPDGECYTAPVRDSVSGVLSFNTVSVYQGFAFHDVRFEFENGRIVRATSNDNDRINAVLDTDEGARYIGEWSLGFNPYILHPMRDTLFDEKIAGSFHMTPGECYQEAYNGNHSAIHWDLVCIQRPEYGGGEVYFDGRLIRKDGRFIGPDLEPLNPENLK